MAEILRICRDRVLPPEMIARKRLAQDGPQRPSEFDPQSIMIYPYPGTWVRSGLGTEWNNALSSLDKIYIASRECYPGK